MLLTKPSFYSLAFTGFLLLFIVFVMACNFRRMRQLSPESLIKILSLVGILIGIHGLQHLGLEVVYKYNPME